MRVLIIGGGGREHAIAAKLAEEGHEILAVPGNPGMAKFARLGDYDLKSFSPLVDFAKYEGVDLIFVGPEGPLASGIVNYMRACQVPICGPTKYAAQIETSKGFSIQLLMRACVRVPDTIVLPSYHFLGVTQPMPYPFVVKFDGLAAGKGVVIVHNHDEAIAARVYFENYRPGEYLVQEKVTGPELSFFVTTDGVDLLFLGSAQDYKPLYPGGPNTGGMGGFAPHPLLTPELRRIIEETIVKRTIRAMAEAGCSYQGIMYFQLMLTQTGPVVIEINCRFGDPEAELLMPLLDSPLLPILMATADGTLGMQPEPRFKQQVAVAVVMASEGYPDTPKTGRSITGFAPGAGPNENPECYARVYHAGTKVVDGQLVTSGGRVLTVVGTGSDYTSAKANAMAAVNLIKFEGEYHRADIGDEAIAAEG